ncbi:hypothetical protein O181_085250 [Austropuccinia psidii MF-1]|uniref:Integrase catalytic domain-containing protein n=1 Tax=Austropuccinia psidii MF-1 TaxID=1389203 RepID=A0A9Q3FRU3_9BASI|nr:hypothetical protein [Austropuccinia psidii MF-1]
MPLITLGPFLKKNCCLIGKGDVVELVRSNGETLLTWSPINRVFCVKLMDPKANHISFRGDALTIHKALGHPSLQYATRMRPEIDFSSVNYESCIISKSHRLPFYGSFPLARMPLECVQMDLCGPISPLSKGKNKYILQIVDGYSCYRFAYMLSQKSLAFEAFKAFKAYSETQTDFMVRKVVTDNGGEFIGTNFKTLFESEGIECLLTAPHTPQQNPFSEQADRTLLERTRCLLLDSKLDHSWWGEALSTAAYLLNRTSVASIGFKMPFSLFFWKRPKDRQGFFLGYVKGHKNYKVINKVTGKLQITHEFIFHDTSIGLENPSESPAIVFTIPSIEVYTPVPVLAAAEVEDSSGVSSCGSSQPPSCAQAGHTSDESTANAAESWSLEPTKSLPKGWVMQNVPVIARNDISSSIDRSNIFNSKRSRDQHVAMADSIPKSYSQAISDE